MALLQVQALIVSLLSGILAFGLGLLSRNGVHHALQHPIYNPLNPALPEPGSERGNYFEASLVLCVSMLAASASSAVLGSFMCSLVIASRRFGLNPDNFAAPVAAALGDLVTLTIVAAIAKFWRLFMGSIASTAVFICLLAAIGANVVVTFRNAYVHELLAVGFGPLLIAMAISSGSGVVLETYVNAYTGFALLATVLTALSGGAGSVFVSRISTALHSSSREHYLVTALSLYVLTAVVMVLCLVIVTLAGVITGQVAFAVGFVTLCVQVSGLLFPHLQASLLNALSFADPDITRVRVLLDARAVEDGLRPGRVRPPAAHLDPGRHRPAFTRLCIHGQFDGIRRWRCFRDGLAREWDGDGEFIGSGSDGSSGAVGGIVNGK